MNIKFVFGDAVITFLLSTMHLCQVLAPGPSVPPLEKHPGGHTYFPRNRTGAQVISEKIISGREAGREADRGTEAKQDAKRL